MDQSSNHPSSRESFADPLEAALPAGAARLKVLQSLTRLLIGGTEVGVYELFRQLEIWEAEVERWKRQKETNPPGGGLPQAPTLDLAEHERTIDLARYALIGWIFSMQEATAQKVKLASRASRLLGRFAQSAFRPLKLTRQLPGFAHLDQRFERLAARGRSEMENWIAIGRSEEEHSQMLASAAFDKTIDHYIEYLTHNPEVKDLVQSQSTGLATEVIEEVRERTVSADTFLEGIARSLLRKVPRGIMPEPPPEVRSGAIHVNRKKRLQDDP